MSVTRTLATLLSWSCILACGGDDDARGNDDGNATSSAAATTTQAFDPTTGPGPKADLGVDVPSDCQAACVLRVACLGEAPADCLLACSGAYDQHAAASTECVAAYETLLACVASLDCDEAVAYQTGTGDYPCATEELALGSACGDPEMSPTCDALCATTATCTGADPGACATLCSEALQTAAAVSASCQQAQIAAFDCVAALDCEGYAAWESGEGDYPCRLEDESLTLDCQGDPG
jgi:hypothetical protein